MPLAKLAGAETTTAGAWVSEVSSLVQEAADTAAARSNAPSVHDRLFQRCRCMVLMLTLSAALSSSRLGPGQIPDAGILPAVSPEGKLAALDASGVRLDAGGALSRPGVTGAGFVDTKKSRA